MMHRLRRYDVFRFAQNDVAPLRFAMMRCLPQCAVRHASFAKRTSLGEAVIICRRQTSFKKRTFVGRQIRLFCCLKRVKRSKIEVKAKKGQLIFYFFFCSFASFFFLASFLDSFPKDLLVQRKFHRHGEVLKWSKRRDSKSRRTLTRRVGSNPTFSANKKRTFVYRQRCVF